MNLNQPFGIDAYSLDSGGDIVSQIPFGKLIGRILTASIDAQEHASDVAWEYTQKVLSHATPLVFNFMDNGEIKSLEVPLITIVPLPYLRLDKVDIDFDANVNIDNQLNNQFIVNMNNADTTTGTTVQTAKAATNMRININAGTTNMPTGLSSLMQYLQGGVIVENLTPGTPDSPDNAPNYWKIFKEDYKDFVVDELERGITDDQILRDLINNTKLGRQNSRMQRGILEVAREYIKKFHYREAHPASADDIHALIRKSLRNQISQLQEYHTLHNITDATLKNLNQWRTLLNKHRTGADAARGVTYATLKVPTLDSLQSNYCNTSQAERIIARLRTYARRDISRTSANKPQFKSTVETCLSDWLMLFLRQYYSTKSTPTPAPNPDSTKPKSAGAQAQEDAKKRKQAEREEQQRRQKEAEEARRKEEADRKAKEEAERKAKEEADRKAKEEAEQKAKKEAEEREKRKYPFTASVSNGLDGITTKYTGDSLLGIQTIWSRPVTEIMGITRYELEDIDLLTTIYSALLWRRHNGRIKLYTDTVAYKYLMKMEMTNLWNGGFNREALDNIPMSVIGQVFYNAGKVYALEAENQKGGTFVMLDTDVTVTGSINAALRGDATQRSCDIAPYGADNPRLSQYLPYRQLGVKSNYDLGWKINDIDNATPYQSAIAYYDSGDRNCTNFIDHYTSEAKRFMENNPQQIANKDAKMAFVENRLYGFHLARWFNNPDTLQTRKAPCNITKIRAAKQNNASALKSYCTTFANQILREFPGVVLSYPVQQIIDKYTK